MVYIVEGNIGAGKSTFLSLLKKALPTASIIQEPVNNWASRTQGTSLLENFYTNPSRWAYTLETFTMITRSLELQAMEKHPGIVIMERSLYSGHYCFAQNGHEQGFFNAIEWEVYNEWARYFLQKKNTPPQGFIYLRTKPEICLSRIQKRSRNGEQTVSLEYLEQIHNRHDHFLLNKTDVFAEIQKTPVLSLDTNNDFEDNSEEQLKHMQHVKEFIAATTQAA